MDQQFLNSKLTATVLRVLACAVVFCSLTTYASKTVGQEAQQNAPKFEIGAHVTTLGVAAKGDHDTTLGLRFTYNLTDYVGLEAETNRFLESREGGGTNETQGLFGIRAGIRKRRYGLFAKVRPGVTRFYSLGVSPGPNAFADGHSRFSLDVGGVFEHYPHRNLAFRVDVGDTMINFKDGDFFYDRLDTPNFVRSGLSHNLQVSVGVAFRF